MGVVEEEEKFHEGSWPSKGSTAGEELGPCLDILIEVWHLPLDERHNDGHRLASAFTNLIENNLVFSFERTHTHELVARIRSFFGLGLIINTSLDEGARGFPDMVGCS